MPQIPPSISPGRKSSEEAILRTRQAEVLAQGLALVFAPEDATALEFGHDAIDEVVETGGEEWEHYVEPVTCVGCEPHSVSPKEARSICVEHQ